MRLLVVDDVPAMRMFLRMVLSSLHAQIDDAGDGVAAIRLLTSTRYDLVFLDLNLPLLDGMKVLAKAGSAPPEQRSPVIIVSTISDPEMLARAQALGAVHVLPKPVDAFQLLDAAREVLGMPEMSNTDERRARRRIRVAVQIAFHGDDTSVEAATFDVSVSGAFIVADLVKPLGTIGKALFTVPHLSAQVALEFEVVHVRTTRVGSLPAGMGVRFVNVSPEIQEQIFAMLASPL